MDAWLKEDWFQGIGGVPPEVVACVAVGLTCTILAVAYSFVSMLVRSLVIVLRGYPPLPPPEPPAQPPPALSDQQWAIKSYRNGVEDIMKRCSTNCPNCGYEDVCDVDPAPAIAEFNAGFEIAKRPKPEPEQAPFPPRELALLKEYRTGVEAIIESIMERDWDSEDEQNAALTNAIREFNAGLDKFIELPEGATNCCNGTLETQAAAGI